MASIKKRGNSYRIIVSNGRDIYGKQILETATFKPDPTKTEKQNQKALERFAFEFENKVKNGKYLDGEKLTLADFSEKWIKDYAEIQLEPTTTDVYKMHLRVHILPALGHLKLSRIQPAHLNSLYASMLKKRKDGKEGGYSANTIKRIHALISSIMSTALRWNIITENPCERVRPPKMERDISDIHFFTPEQTADFLSALDEQTANGFIKLQHNLFFHIALFCGLRRGECVSLLWDDVDMDHKTISITKSTAIVNGKLYTKTPKNKSSVRVVSVPDHIIQMLKRYHIEYNTYRMSIGTQWIGSGHIFITWNGSQMYPSTPSAVFKDVLHRYNDTHEEPLPEITLHDLRHTSATLLISQNIDVRTVANRLGHAQTSTTMNIYSHALQKKDESAAQTLENMFIKAPKSC